MQDYAEAYKLISLAASQGLREAVGARNSLASRMTEEQMDEARRRMKEVMSDSQ